MEDAYDVVFGNIKVTQRGSEADATFVSLPPREGGTRVYDGGTVGVCTSGSLQEGDGSKRHIICLALLQSIHLNIFFDIAKEIPTPVCVCVRKRDRELV